MKKYLIACQPVNRAASAADPLAVQQERSAASLVRFSQTPHPRTAVGLDRLHPWTTAAGAPPPDQCPAARLVPPLAPKSIQRAIILATASQTHTLSLTSCLTFCYSPSCLHLIIFLSLLFLPFEAPPPAEDALSLAGLLRAFVPLFKPLDLLRLAPTYCVNRRVEPPIIVTPSRNTSDVRPPSLLPLGRNRFRCAVDVDNVCGAFDDERHSTISTVLTFITLPLFAILLVCTFPLACLPGDVLPAHIDLIVWVPLPRTWEYD